MQVGQVNPVGIPQAPLTRPALLQGLTYNVDLSFAFPYGSINYNAGIPGGMDAGTGYAFSRTNRVQLGYYEIQTFPLGFSNKTVPFYVRGLSGPGTALSQILPEHRAGRRDNQGQVLHRG